jgi:hypothetical protein
MTTNTRTWPTREQWEADERRHAEYTIEYGINSWDFGSTRAVFTIVEQDEVEALAPEAIKTIRRACSRIERDLRQTHPDAAALARGPQEANLEERRATPGACRANYPTAADTDRWYDAVDALTGTDRDAYDVLRYLSHVRIDLRRYPFDDPRPPRGCAIHVNGTDPFTWDWERSWPPRYALPTSPEIERLRELNDQAVERWHESNREMGRHILADLDSGVRWQRELEHRAKVEEYFRNGPVIHRVRVGGA